MERRMILQQYNDDDDDGDILDVEILSSPPSTALSLDNGKVTIVSQETLQDKVTTPFTLGGSRFRRKPIIPTDISSPLAIPANHDIDIDSNPLFDSQDSIPSISAIDSLDSILSPPQYEPSTSETSGSATSRRTLTARTSSGKTVVISKKPPWKAILKDQQRRTAAREQKESYYGIDIHNLLNTIENHHQTQSSSTNRQ